MICQPFYFTHSIEEPFSSIPINENHRKTYACKFLEFSRLNYIYLRHFLPKDEHIFFLGNGSPKPIDYLTSFIDEPMEFLGKDDYKLNMDVRIHIKSFENRLENPLGYLRMTKECLKMCYLNNFDYLLNEIDSLLAYNILEDSRKYNFVTRSFSDKDRSCELFSTFISKEILHFRDKFIDLDKFLDKIEDNYPTGVLQQFLYEGGLYKMFAFDNPGEMSQKDRNVHDCDFIQLKKFILQNKVNHQFVDYYLEQLENKINNK
jgi:hypothetical protein